MPCARVAASSTIVQAAEHWCAACYTGSYRIDIDHPQTGVVLDAEQMKMFG
ncbi:hypothetical protein J4558_14560 [Leptolyngbya sp. 15MV]|nr:hypothetical protein J4558_14560 [Leptolyngbya sp. 15MV]